MPTHSGSKLRLSASRSSARIATSVLILLSAASAYAQEATTFTYDALGRLIATSNSGGPRDGKSSSSTYDDAGNRVTYAVGTPAPLPSNPVSFSISSAGSVEEGQTAVFAVTKTGAAYGALSVSFASANGSAAAPGDFAAVSGTLTFRSWETRKTISVPIIQDNVSEAAESFSVALSSATGGATISTGSASVTIPGAAVNQPPVTTPDQGYVVGTCSSITVNVLANDSDPEGQPMHLVSVYSLDGMGDPSIVGTDHIYFRAFGTASGAGVRYTVSDSLGATSTGDLTLLIQDQGGCN